MNPAHCSSRKSVRATLDGTVLLLMVAAGVCSAAELYGWTAPPTPGIRVALCTAQNKLASGEGNPATTDARGYYHFQNIVPGAYSLHVGQASCTGPGQPVYVEPGVTRFDVSAPGR